MDTPTMKRPASTVKRRSEGHVSLNGQKRIGPKAKAHGLDANFRPVAEINYDILPNQVGFWVRRAQLSIMKSFYVHTQALDLRPVEAAALLLIDKNANISQIALAAALVTDQSTMVALCTRLEKRGLIERRRLEEDRRYQLLNLTREGVKMVENIRKSLAAHDEGMTRGLSQGQRENLIALLRKLSNTEV